MIFIQSVNFYTINQTDKISKFDTVKGILSQLQSQLLSCEEIEQYLTKLLKKINTAIQQICQKKRVTLQRIFRFINEGALNIKSEFFQDYIYRLEIGGRIYKKSGKNTSFLKSHFHQQEQK